MVCKHLQSMIVVRTLATLACSQLLPCRTKMCQGREQGRATTCIHIKQVVPGHARLARDAGWDDNKVAAIQRRRQAVWANMAGDLTHTSRHRFCRSGTGTVRKFGTVHKLLPSY